jgi:ribosome biogenesis GTPase A
MSTPPVQWYPGHIAKAERKLTDQLKKVDVILEVRDARIPLATHHPNVSKWIGVKGRVLVMNRMDMIPDEVRSQWFDWMKEHDVAPQFTDGHSGRGIKELAGAIKQAGIAINRRRRDRGMLPRPIRCVMIGFPNVGKSALINRLIGKRVVESARKAGVTRSLRWVRISDEVELLDAPGVLPNKLEDQASAVKLAMCDDIGQAAYDHQRVGSALVDLIKNLNQEKKLTDHYKINATEITGESFLEALGDLKYQGDKERAANLILNDFRIGKLGAIALELPPEGPVESPPAPNSGGAGLGDFGTGSEELEDLDDLDDEES